MDKLPKWLRWVLKVCGIVVVLVALHLALRKPLDFLIVYITARMGCC